MSISLCNKKSAFVYGLVFSNFEEQTSYYMCVVYALYVCAKVGSKLHKFFPYMVKKTDYKSGQEADLAINTPVQCNIGIYAMM